jgi:hypothetical protein
MSKDDGYKQLAELDPDPERAGRKVALHYVSKQDRAGLAGWGTWLAQEAVNHSCAHGAVSAVAQVNRRPSPPCAPRLTFGQALAGFIGGLAAAALGIEPTVTGSKPAATEGTSAGSKRTQAQIYAEANRHLPAPREVSLSRENVSPRCLTSP